MDIHTDFPSEFPDGCGVSLNLQLRDRQSHHCNSVKKETERHSVVHSYSWGHWSETALVWVHLVLRPGLPMCYQLPLGHTTPLDAVVCFLWNRLLLCSPGWPRTCILPDFISQEHRCAAPNLAHPWRFLTRQTHLFNDFQRTQKWVKTPATFGNPSIHPELTSFERRPFPVWRFICVQPWYPSSWDFSCCVLSLSHRHGTASAGAELTSCPHLPPLSQQLLPSNKATAMSLGINTWQVAFRFWPICDLHTLVLIIFRVQVAHGKAGE